MHISYNQAFRSVTLYLADPDFYYTDPTKNAMKFKKFNLEVYHTTVHMIE